MSGPFVVREVETTRGRVRFQVANTADGGRPVADFDDRRAAEEHADKLNAGPLDWDEQEAWQDDDDWGEGDWASSEPGAGSGDGDQRGADS